jgi:phage/plasmid-associated DNA primase
METFGTTPEGVEDQGFTFGEAVVVSDSKPTVMVANDFKADVEAVVRQFQKSLKDDVLHFVQPILSMYKIRLIEVKMRLQPNDDDKEILVEAGVAALENAQAKVAQTFGQKLTMIGDLYLKYAGFDSGNFVANGKPSMADEDLVRILTRYVKTAIRIQFGFPIPDDNGKMPQFDSARIAAGLRTAVDIITPFDELVTASVVRVYDSDSHFYVQFEKLFGTFWTVLTSRVLELRPATHVEMDTLLAMARLADRYHQNFANKAYVTLGNGDLDLETFEIVDYSPDHLTTYALPIAPNVANTTITPAWQQFFDGQWKDDGETIRFIIQWLSVHLLPFNVGVFLVTTNPGGGGKSLLNKAIRRLVGAILTASVKAEAFSRTFGPEMLLASDRVTTRKANVVDENGAALPWNFMKNVADKDATMTIDRKNTSAITIPIDTKFTLATNELADSDDDVEQTYAAQRKTRLLVFPKSFLPEEQDEMLEGRMLDELNDMGGLMLQELKAMKVAGSFTPVESPKMIADKEAWFANMTKDKSPVASFISSSLKKEVGSRLARNQIRAAFTQYLADEAIPGEGYDKSKKLWPKFRELVPLLLHTSPEDTKSGNDFYFNDIAFVADTNEEVGDVITIFGG